MSAFGDADPPIEDDGLDDAMDNAMDGGLDSDLDDGASSFFPSASASSRVPDSQISLPSGLPIDAIAWLTHDELRHNPEFMKHLSLVDALLLNVRSTPSASKLPPLPSCHIYLFFQQLSLRRCMVACAHHFPSLPRIDRAPALPTTRSRSFGPKATARWTPTSASLLATRPESPCGVPSGTKMAP
jgi:hypothetical protein